MKILKFSICILLCMTLAGCVIRIDRPDGDQDIQEETAVGNPLQTDPEMPAVPTEPEDTSPCGFGVHDYALSNTKEASCEESGLKEYKCPYCGDIYTEELPATGHSYDKNGTCTVCQDQLEGAREYITFHDPYLENYVKQALGIAASEKVSVYAMKQLRGITVDTGVKDVQDLQYAVNLESFELNTNNVQNLDVLCQLPMLRSIAFRMGVQVDITFMKDMKHLTDVNWSSAELVGGDIAYLVASPELTRLYYYAPGGEGIEFLEGANKLEELELWHAYSTDDNIDVLLRLPSLKVLEVLTYADLPSAQDEVFRQLMANGVSIRFI